jgi:hypothetical protein
MFVHAVHSILMMEGYQGSWFDGEGILHIPLDEIGPGLERLALIDPYLSLCWREWGQVAHGGVVP